MFFPVVPEVGAFGELLLTMRSERFDADGGERDGSLGVVGLGPDELETALDTLKGLDHFEFRAVEVDVHPAEPEQLPASQPEAERQDVEGRQPVLVSGLEDQARLRDGQAAVDLVLGHRDLDELRRVTRNDLLTYRRLQGVAEYGVHGLNHAGRRPGLAGSRQRL
ncbi:hypothetical protein GCM10022252_45760 [Streptosporangium oxazolinicum]|uniref:Uncharacterized protein n=1 Tax=Streptosporangium oxazolinicum TaxID=909287 RepID=A0ABP8B432_9ACTN